MATLFLVIIYLAFISLGLPDSLLGVAWPLMRIELGKGLEAAGMVSMVISGGTILSSLASGYVLKRMNTGMVTFISCFMTACALLGFSLSPSLFWIILSAIPLGLGAGSIDAGLNHYVATHYKAHHMSWLHCFWGIGATLSPLLMSHLIKTQGEWRKGYQTVSIIQFVLVLVLFVTLPLWKRDADQEKNALKADHEVEPHSLSTQTDKKFSFLSIKGVPLALLSFLFYCGVESTMGLWGSSFLMSIKGLSAATAAQWVSLYYGGITAGRLITGFVTMRVSNPVLIRIGQLMTLAGALLIVLPLPAFFSLIGFILVGLGCAPIFPCMLHETPVRFGKEHSQTIMGLQMALAYTGSSLLPPLLGWIASATTIGILPFFVIAYIVIMYGCSEKINTITREKTTFLTD